MDDAVLKTNFPDISLLPARQPDLPSGHRFMSEHLATWWEAINFDGLLQKGAVRIVIRLLDVVIQLHNLLLILPFSFCSRRCSRPLPPCTIGMIRPRLFAFQDAFFTITQ